MSKSKTMKVKVVTVAGGTENTKEYEVPVTVEGTTVDGIVKSLKLDIKNKNVFVNGMAADGETFVKSGEKLELRVAERPQGS